MNCAHVKIRLANAARLELSPVETEAVADSRTLFLMIPAYLSERLRLEAVSTRIIPGESGDYEVCPYVGPVQVQLGGQTCFVGAVVSGSRVWLGTLALSSMNLAVDPATNKVVTDPAGPPRIVRLSAGGER